MKLNRLQKQWVFYDVACSAFTLILTVTIPVYFRGLIDTAGIDLVCNNQFVQMFFSKNANLALLGDLHAFEALKSSLYGLTTSIAVLIVAMSAPFLGALADYFGLKKKLFAISLLIGLGSLVMLSCNTDWILFMVYLIVVRIAYSASNIFYDSMLIDIADESIMDKVSTYGYAYGYIGSVLPFVIGLYLILFLPFGLEVVAATQISFLIVVVWWFIGAYPLLKNYKQKYGFERHPHILKESITRVINTVKVVSHNKKVLYFIIGYFCYIDGVYTIISMSTTYGAEVGISDNVMIIALMVTQIVAFPFSILAGKLAQKFETLKIIKIYILIYMLIVIYGFFLDTAFDFWVLCISVGIDQGGIQSLSRSYFGKIIPKDEASEYFGFFDIFGKFADFFGPLIITICAASFGSSRYGILALIILFIIGFILISKVEKIEKE